MATRKPKTARTPAKQPAPQRARPLEMPTVNPFFISGGFLRYCVDQGWLAIDGTGKRACYRVTPVGRKALKSRFQIEV